MNKILLISLLLCCQFSAYAEYSPKDQRTIRAGFDSLQWLQYLHTISKKCSDLEYAELAPRADLEELITTRLKVSLEKLEILAEENETFMETLFNEINKVDCSRIDVNQYLSDIYDKYDVAIFNLSLYEPIAYPLMTEREVAHLNEASLDKYITSKTSEAETILLAELIPIEKAPKAYLAQLKEVSYERKYIYKIIKGWRKSISFQYVTPPPTAYYSTNEKVKNLISETGKTNVLLFIKTPVYSFSTSEIIGSINLDFVDVDISFLKEHEWEWVNNTFTYK